MTIYYGLCFALFFIRVINSRDHVGNSLDTIASAVSLGLFINQF